MRTRDHLLISGRVQGVFFRSKAKEMALKLGLRGWVKNLPDGRVEVEMEGEKEKMKKMVDWCHKGPSFAEVTKVTVEHKEYEGEFREFVIRY